MNSAEDRLSDDETRDLLTSVMSVIRDGGPLTKADQERIDTAVHRRNVRAAITETEAE